MNARLMTVAVAILLACAACPVAAQSDEKPAPGVAVTVYNGNFGVVREVRQVTIGDDGVVRFRDVARQIDPTTVHFASLTDPDAKLLEQNYQYDLVSANRLLEKYIDRELTVVAEDGRYSGKLMSFDNHHLVLQADGGEIVMVRRADNVRDIRFSALPGGLLTQPTLVWQVAGAEAGEHLTEVTYQTGGINWHAEYVMVLDRADTRADLTGWVSVDNRSGKTYRDARLKFIAGDVRKVQPKRRPNRRREILAADAAAGGGMEEKAFFEYHMYTLPRPSTVADNETKQLQMFAPAKGIEVTKRYLYNPLGHFRYNRGGRYDNPGYGVTSETDVAVFVEFRNEKENNLGLPLPAGTIRVYKQDPDDEALEFVGEERIDHTPRDEELSLRVGNAFDIVGERKQTDFRRRGDWISETVRIEIRNHKKEPATVRIKEPLYRWANWQITDKSEDYQKLDARTVAWDVEVPADGKKVVTYTVEYTW